MSVWVIFATVKCHVAGREGGREGGGEGGGRREGGRDSMSVATVEILNYGLLHRKSETGDIFASENNCQAFRVKLGVLLKF